MNPQLPRHLLIGLTGGIGSGKSTVSALFAEQGARIIDTDELSHSLTQTGGAAIAAIRAAFGDDYIDADGSMDRGKMRDLVFSHPREKARLEAILHPAILDLARQRAAASTSAPYTLLVIPLLFESQGYQDWLHRKLVVDCPEDAQVSRTMQRSKLDLAAVQTIMAQQMDRARRLALADDVIHNDSDLHTLKDQVTRLHRKYLTITAGSD